MCNQLRPHQCTLRAGSDDINFCTLHHPTTVAGINCFSQPINYEDDANAHMCSKTKHSRVHTERHCAVLIDQHELSRDKDTDRQTDRQRCERQSTESDSWVFDWQERLLTLVVITEGGLGGEGIQEYNRALGEEGEESGVEKMPDSKRWFRLHWVKAGKTPVSVFTLFELDHFGDHCYMENLKCLIKKTTTKKPKRKRKCFLCFVSRWNYGASCC